MHTLSIKKYNVLKHYKAIWWYAAVAWLGKITGNKGIAQATSLYMYMSRNCQWYVVVWHRAIPDCIGQWYSINTNQLEETKIRTCGCWEWYSNSYFLKILCSTASSIICLFICLFYFKQKALKTKHVKQLYKIHYQFHLSCCSLCTQLELYSP